mmetsp:Transcript_44268/g.101470  ORF Transcript_44268/g.101470 Transcript_44268/m.101470 type:complete len:85 (+) Transcript_44268:1269-1523(+)
MWVQVLLELLLLLLLEDEMLLLLLLELLELLLVLEVMLRLILLLEMMRLWVDGLRHSRYGLHRCTFAFIFVLIEWRRADHSLQP